MGGETSTGISIMLMDAGMDTGDILLARAMTIGMNDTAETLHDDLADMGGRMLVEALERMLAHKLVRIKQDDARATYAPKLEKSEGRLDWSRTAQEVHDRARAMHPWPGAYFTWTSPRTGKEQRLVVTPGEVGFDLGTPRPLPGSILGVCEGKLAIACADRAYLVPSVKPRARNSSPPRHLLVATSTPARTSSAPWTRTRGTPTDPAMCSQARRIDFLRAPRPYFTRSIAHGA